MKNINNETFQNWSKKGMTGKKNYESVFPFKEGYMLRSEESCDSIKEWAVIVWKKGKVVFQQQWSQKEGESDLRTGLVIKNQRKMMLYDGKETIYSFGMENEIDENEEALVYYQSDYWATLVIASTGFPRIRMLDYVLDESNTDVVAAIMETVMKTMEKAQEENKKEGENNEPQS